MGKYASARNFGFGKQLAYAGREALRAYYADGHYGSVAAHSDRWNQFAHWAKAQGIRDLARVDQQATFERYAAHVASRVQDQAISVQYGQNLLSTVNVTLAALRGDDRVRLSPAQAVGRRSQVRTQAPDSLDRARVSQAATALRAAGLGRAAAVLELARDFGVRREEAVKADLGRWSREAERHGAVNVQDGTKGGRDAPRWVPMTDQGRETLASALATRPAGSPNLVAPHETYAQVAITRDSELNVARAILHVHGITGYHDARAAYACERYRALTGNAAPVVTGKRPNAEQCQSDAVARAVIAHELGHGRLEVVSSYIGGR
ncbi:integrase domain-containing protein [Thiocapsa sp. UBA6158]|jgi:hypothetical protein|uniref:integrase domain-containing protein n=1 Tax=Thiocapsa sp. UBA6158 TaxID=1947692 RepID=UPI0025D5218D|nr:integrase domain-containing protein [Thiocapsa sp. UBA6158]